MRLPSPLGLRMPGEKEPGKYHYNPGNMSGKTMDSCKAEVPAASEC